MSELRNPDLRVEGRRVVCKQTGLVWRTLATRRDAEKWANQAAREMPQVRREYDDYA